MSEPAPPFAVLTALTGALLVLTLAWAPFDARLLAETPVWAKPMKFALSFVVLYATMAPVVARLSPLWRQGRMVRGVALVMAAATVVEMAYILTMAARGEASHFNLTTPVTRAMYTVMGIGAVALVLGVGLIGMAALRDDKAALGPATRQAVGWGFLASFLLTLVIAGYIGGNGTYVGAELPGAPRLPLMGWSGTVGDLRPAHFLALHAMQALPLLGLWLDRRGGSARAIPLAALAWAALTLAVFFQGLMGLPLIRLG